MSVNPFAGYVKVSVGEIPQKKLERALKGLEVRITNANLSGDRVMMVHPQNARQIKKAQKAGKGISTQFTPFEALADLDYHEKSGGNLHGGSLWSWLKNKAYPWVKNNWGTIKPILGALADVAIPAVATAMGAPTAGAPVRSAVKVFTGVGNKRTKLVKGSEEAREHMAQLRAKRKGGSIRKRKNSEEEEEEEDGGSFRMP